jgi:hypothetical protein
MGDNARRLGRVPLAGLVGALLLSGTALADFGEFDSPTPAARPSPSESPRLKTPNDPNFDRCEADDEDTPERECTSYFGEQYGLFGFAPDSSTAVYADPSQLDQQGRDANVKAGNDPNRQISGVRADTAWKYSTGDPGTVVAILDTGIEWEDRELVEKVHLNTAELPKPRGSSSYDKNGDGLVNVTDWAGDPRVSKTAGDNGPRPGDKGADEMLDASDLIATFSDRTDADGNGYVDDIAGWDFFDDDNDPYDASSCCSATGHGTDRGKSAVGDTNNGDDDASLCPECQIMPLRVWDTFVVDGSLFALATVYAADNGARVVEGAVGGLSNPNFGRRAFSYADKKGVSLMLVSSDINSANHNYPTNYNEAVYVAGAFPDTAPGEDCATPDFPGIGGGQDVPGCPQILNAIDQASGGTIQPSSQPPTTSFFRNSNLTQYGGKADIVLMGSTGSENTGQAAGAAALLHSFGAKRFGGQSAFPKTLSGNEVRQLLTMSAEDVKPANTGVIGLPDKAQPGWDPHFGYGRVNLAGAMAMIQAGRIPPEAQLDAPDWFAPIDVDRMPAGGVPIKGRIAAPHSAGGVGSWTVEYACGQDAPDSIFKPVPGASGTGARTGLLGRLSPELLKELADSCDGSIANDAGLPAGRPGDAWPVDPFPKPDPMRHAFQIRLTVQEAGDPQNIGRYRKTLFAYNDDGTHPGWPKAIGSGSVQGDYVTGSGGETSPRLYDLNGDNRLDVLLPTSSGELWALDSRGEPLSSWNRGRPAKTDVYAVAAAHPRNGSLGDPPRETLRSPVIGDVTGDGEPEILATAGEHVYAWTLRGRRLDGFPVRIDPDLSGSCKPGAPTPCFDVKDRLKTRDNHIKRGFSGSPALADLNGDGDLDVVAGSLDQHVYAWDGRGRSLPGFPVKLQSPDAPGAEIITSPAIANLDGKGTPEVVIGTNEVVGSDPELPSNPADILSSFTSSATGATVVYALRGNGKPVSGWPVKLGVLAGDILPFVLPSNDAAVLDLDGDGDDEVAVSAATAVAKLVDGDGSVIRSFTSAATAGQVTDASTQLNLADYPSVGDITGDGRPEVIKGGLSLNGAVNLLAVNQNFPFNHVEQAWDTRTGTYLPGYPVATDDFQLLSQAVIAKVTRSGSGRQALVGTGLYQLHAYNADGSEPSGWPKFTGGWIFATPAVGDADGDGKLDVMTLTREGWSFLWRTNVPVCKQGSQTTNDEWWTVRHDEHGTADYGHDARPPSRPGPLSRSAESDGDLRLGFAASGDDMLCGKARRYEVRASSRPITNGERFARARRLSADASASLAAAGDRQTLHVPDAARHRYIAVRALDDARNASFVRQASSSRQREPSGDRRRGRGGGTGAAGTVRGAGTQGTLPFTGYVLWVLVLLAVELLAAGAYLRWRSRRANL